MGDSETVDGELPLPLIEITYLLDVVNKVLYFILILGVEADCLLGYLNAARAGSLLDL